MCEDTAILKPGLAVPQKPLPFFDMDAGRHSAFTWFPPWRRKEQL